MLRSSAGSRSHDQASWPRATKARRTVPENSQAIRTLTLRSPIARSTSRRGLGTSCRRRVRPPATRFFRVSLCRIRRAARRGRACRGTLQACGRGSARAHRQTSSGSWPRTESVVRRSPFLKAFQPRKSTSAFVSRLALPMAISLARATRAGSPATRRSPVPIALK